MGRRKDENLRKIQQSGKKGSYHITLPVSIVRELKWKEGQKVVVSVDKKSKTIKIKDWRKGLPR